VHISSGSAGLAYALVLGNRRRHKEKHVYKPHNVTIVFLGTVLIWFGWFGFNGGSAINASMRAMVAVWNTNMAASTVCIFLSDTELDAWCAISNLATQAPFFMMLRDVLTLR
jgi:ammonia channel protein AmtB